jgi:epoxyqueuosine reductase
MIARMRTEFSEAFEARICVDTAPLLEREWAELAGIGWIGKNTLVLHQTLGSYFFLGGIITTLELEPDEAIPDHCGTCTACLDACPTAAFPSPYEMDASRCISYLTIEHRGAIAREFHKAMGSWVFGCDVCQEVCPYNHRAPLATELLFEPRPPAPEVVLDDVLHWSPEDYAANLKGRAMKRAKLDMLQRNAQIALVRRPVRGV